uniref:Inosine/uridine-preferring nucleoside hydrolase domain-containing protein n=1 Tax=Lygus hesperus TaxID=30085 RepID=A0A0K8TDM6_LYGHE
MIKIILTLPIQLVLVVSAYSGNPWQTIGSFFHGSGMMVVDTDAGADDAMAISLILSGTRSSRIHIAGITCVRGNTGVHNVSKNVLRTLEVNGRLEIPVFEGSDYGLIATSAIDDYYFGYDGLGDFNYPVPDVSPSKVPAGVFLADVVRRNPGRVTVVALGPLTNLAVAGLIYPDFYKNAKDIIILGGSTSGIGGMNGSEFNIWADPYAAIAVFSRSPVSNPVTVIPTETFRQVHISWDWRKYVLGTKGTAVMDFLNLAERKEPKSGRGWEVSDQVAAAVAIDPTIVLSLFVGRSHLLPNGIMTVTKDGHDIRVISAVDSDRLKMMLEILL